ncbi:MAG: sugar phosphate isomerase/epimerase [Candidatus Brockarchaeota archaeon]|nr:sugar phosphate isomerase/epimerase [Candidatus Brockarchaeota archaeon]
MFSVELRAHGISLSARFPWKTGIVSFMAFPSMTKGPDELQESVKAIAEDPFFDAVELPLVQESQWDWVNATLHGKDLARGCQPDLLTKKLDLNSPEEQKRMEAVSYVKRQLEECSKRGLRKLALCSGPDPGTERREAARKLLAESLVEVCSHASPMGIKVLLETFDRDWDKKLLIGPLDEAIKVIEAVRKEEKNIGLMWDLSHAPLLGEKPDDLKRAARVLEHVHIGCAKRLDGKLLDSHPVFYTKGAINTSREVAALLQILLEIQYGGIVAFEVKPEEDQTPQQVLDTAKGTLLSAFQEAFSKTIKL